MTRSTRLSILLALCGVVPPAARAQSSAPAPDKGGYTLFDPTPDAAMRAFSTDRPNKSNSPFTVDAGHVQYETDLVGVLTNGYAGSRTSTRTLFTADPVFKLGITNTVDLELALGGYQDSRTKRREAGPVTVADGYGDTVLRAKVNVWGNDGGETAFAVIPYVKIPTASRGLGNNQVEGGLIAPLQVSLPYKLTAVFETELDVLKNGADGGKHLGVTNLVNLSYPVTETLTASAELFSQLQGASTPSIYTADVAVAYLLGPNTQVDGAIYAGLNKAAPDMVAYIGLSQRF